MFSLITIISFNALGLTYQSANFSIEYDNNVPQSVVEKLAEQIESERTLVLTYLNQSKHYQGTPIKEPLVVYISKTKRTPYQDWNTIHLPEKRVLNSFSNSSTDNNVASAVIHELTHVYAVSAYRKNRNRFYDDGLAVFLQHRFGQKAEYPNFGKDLYRATASASIEYGSLIPLEKAEYVRHQSKVGIGRQLAYIQEGAFTQFLIEKFGFDTYLEIYFGADIKTKTGYSFSELENQWAQLIGVLK